MKSLVNTSIVLTLLLLAVPPVSAGGGGVTGDLTQRIEMDEALLAARDRIPSLQILEPRIDGSVDSRNTTGGAALATDDRVASQIEGSLHASGVCVGSDISDQTVQFPMSRIARPVGMRTAIDGAFLAVDDRISSQIEGSLSTSDIDLRVGSIQIPNPRIDGSVDSRTRLNGVVFVSSGRRASVRVGGVEVGPFGMRAASNGGAILAVDDRISSQIEGSLSTSDIDLRVGSIQTLNSRIDGSVEVRTRINGVVLVSAGRNASVRVGGVDIK